MHGIREQDIMTGIYVILGDEPLLTQEALDHLRHQIKKQNVTERHSFYVDAHFDWSAMQERIENISLFAEKKLIELHFSSGKVTKDAQKFLIDYLQLTTSDILLIHFKKLEITDQQSTWYKGLQKQAAVTTIVTVKEHQLPVWIQGRLKKIGFEIDSPTAEYFSSQVAGNLLAAKQEIEKLALLFPSGKLSLTDVQEALSDHAQYDIFALTDVVLTGNSQRCLRILEVLKREGSEPILVLWALAREIRLLIRLAQHEPVSIWESRQSLYQQCLRRINQSREGKNILYRLLQQANQIDQMVKGILPGHIWQAIQMLTLTLCLPQASIY